MAMGAKDGELHRNVVSIRIGRSGMLQLRVWWSCRNSMEGNEMWRSSLQLRGIHGAPMSQGNIIECGQRVGWYSYKKQMMKDRFWYGEPIDHNQGAYIRKHCGC